MKTDKVKSKKKQSGSGVGQVLVAHNPEIYERVKNNKDKTGVPIGKFYDMAAEKELDKS